MEPRSVKVEEVMSGDDISGGFNFPAQLRNAATRSLQRPSERAMQSVGRKRGAFQRECNRAPPLLFAVFDGLKNLVFIAIIAW